MLTGYYQKKKKERLPKKTRERYVNLSEEKKRQKTQYAPERCRNLSGEERKRSIDMVVNDIKIF